MVEYGVKRVITNPTLLTQSDEIVRVVDGRSKQTKAYVVPARYESLMRKMIKEIEFEAWAKEKKRLLEAKASNTEDETHPLSEAGMQSIGEYLDD